MLTTTLEVRPPFQEPGKGSKNLNKEATADRALRDEEEGIPGNRNTHKAWHRNRQGICEEPRLVCLGHRCRSGKTGQEKALETYYGGTCS